jgi:hypothetical protein
MNAWLLTLRGPAGILSQFLARPAAIPRARVAETERKANYCRTDRSAGQNRRRLGFAGHLLNPLWFMNSQMRPIHV